MLAIPLPKGQGINKAKTLYERSLIIEGAKLFNLMPREIREHGGSLDTLKTKIDNFLAKIPDQPQGNKYIIPATFRTMAPNKMAK